MVDSLESEVECHELDDGAEAMKTGTDGDTSETSLSNGSVYNTPIAVFVPHTLRHLICAIVLGDLLTNEENVLVALDLFGHRGVDGLTHSHLLVENGRSDKSPGGEHLLEEGRARPPHRL